MSKIVERIRLFLDDQKISISQFEKAVGLSNAAFSKIYKSGGSMGTDKLENILSVYPNLSPDWLITGQGPMMKSQSEAPVAHPATEPGQGIPLIPISASAGIMRGETTILEYECERYVVPVFTDADFLIPVKGSSMYPKYNSGDIVACRRLTLTDLFIQWNKVYVIDTDQGILIKRITPGPSKQVVTIVSDNVSYAPFELPLSHIHSIAIVIGVIRLE